MYIDFRAEYFSIDNSAPISEAMKEYYKKILQSVFDQLSIGMELSRLKSIVVPNDFKTELYEFQKSHGVTVGATDNDMGVAQGQVVSYTQNGNTVDTIFFNKNLATAIIDDITINTMGEEEKELAIKCRKISINLLHHELAHVHDASLSGVIYNDVTDEETNNYLLKTLREFAVAIWKEYFACRVSASTYYFDFDDVENIINQIRKVGEKVKVEIDEYRFHGDINKLVSVLQTRSLILMKYVAYFQGHLAAENDSDLRNKIFEAVGAAIADTFFNNIWIKMNIELNKLYETYNDWQSRAVFDALGKTVKSCWNTLGVYPNKVENGVYYSVPMNNRNNE